MSPDFKKADVVMLRSGGPHLTVTTDFTDQSWAGRVAATWFDLHGKLRFGTFDPNLLKLVQRD